jgi:hypothetical protein
LKEKIMSRIYIGIDNGITGSIGIITPEESFLYPTPSISQQDFTKKKQNISRLNRTEFKDIILKYGPYDSVFVLMERPFWNPMLSPKSSKSGVMCLESQLSLIEDLMWPHDVIDSKAWQKELLPDGVKKSPELKKASKDIGIRLFPMLEEEIKKQKDADGILIAEFARRRNL